MKNLAYILIIIVFTCSCNKKKNPSKNTMFDKEVFSDSYTINSLTEFEDTSDNETCIIYVEEMPIFKKNGNEELYKFLKENTEYPQTAIDDNIEGRVYVKFIIETDGSISNVEVVKGVRYDLDEECIRVIEMMPNWIPGKVKGKAVRSPYVFPMRFELDSVLNEKESKRSQNYDEDISIKIYPNPAIEYTNIELSVFKSNLEYQICDNKGQVVKKGRFHNTCERIQISELKSGLYIIRLISETSGVIETEKMIKK